METRKGVSFSWVRLPHSSGVHLAACNADRWHFECQPQKNSVPYALLASRDGMQTDVRVIGLYWADCNGPEITVHPSKAEDPAEASGIKFRILDSLASILYAGFPESTSIRLMLGGQAYRVGRSSLDSDREAWAKGVVMRIAGIQRRIRIQTEATPARVQTHEEIGTAVMPMAAWSRNSRYGRERINA